jgi:hypothetical protein
MLEKSLLLVTEATLFLFGIFNMLEKFLPLVTDLIAAPQSRLKWVDYISV